MTARIFRPASLPQGMDDALRSAEQQIDDSRNLETYEVAALPDPGPPYRWIFVTDETGGPTGALNNGTDWLRFPDGAVVS